MSRKLSQTRKAVSERKLRSDNYKQKHFNVPLRKFIEHKYSDIYTEYVELYNLMVSKHPNRRNLATSKTFREWMNENSAVGVPPTDIISVALREALYEDANQNLETPDQNHGTPAVQIGDQSPGTLATGIPVDERPTGNDNENKAESTGADGEPGNIEAAVIVPENIEADVIINELMGNQDWRDLFDQTQDEGIELNVFDEIEFDIEPFDYRLEVEEYDY